MTILPFTLHSRSLELDQDRKTLAIRDGDVRIELPRADVAQMVSFLLAHPTFFEDQPAHEDLPRPIPVVPSMASLLEDGISAETSKHLLMGVHASTGEPYWSTWQDFRSGVVAGRGRSGVTNTLLFLIAQAILSGVEVWIADLQFNKVTSLATFLRPLAHHYRLAGTVDDITHLFEDWDREMERRKAEAGPFKPLLVVFDGWGGILEQFDTEGEQAGNTAFSRQGAVASVTKCAREMGSYEMFVLLGVKSFNEQEIGGAALRRLMHTLICHRMPADCCCHMLPRKYADQAEGLRTGKCILKDNEGSYSLLAVPHVRAENIATIARRLQETE